MNASLSPSPALWPAWAALLALAIAGLSVLGRPAPGQSSPAELGELAIALYKMGRPVEAQARMDALMAQNPSPPPRLLYAAGLLAFDSQKPREAAAYLERAASGMPNDADVWVTLGAAYQVDRRYAEAEAVYAKMLAKDPNNPRVLYNAALIKLHLNQPREGRDLLLRFKAANPNPMELKYVDQKLAQLDAILERGMTAPPPAPRGVNR